MRHAPALLALALLQTAAAAAAPVGVAVVGFSGEEPAALQLLAGHVRHQLAAHADPAVMSVVPREAMTRVYGERGPCSPSARQRRSATGARERRWRADQRRRL